MANHLPMAKINGVIGLRREGWSQRRIAEALGIDRKTVSRHLGEEEAKGAKAPTGNAPTGSVDSKGAKAPTGSEADSGEESDRARDIEGSESAQPESLGEEPKKSLGGKDTGNGIGSSAPSSTLSPVRQAELRHAETAGDASTAIAPRIVVRSSTFPQSHAPAPEYLSHEVWVRWNQHTVRIFNRHFDQIALHTRHEPGRFSTHAGHIASEKITGVERGAEWLLKKASCVGPEVTRWAEAMLAHRGVEGLRVLQGLLALTKKHRSEELEAACGSAWRHQAYQLRTVRKLLERRGDDQQVFEYLEEHPLIRSMSEYGQFVHESIQGGISDV